MPRFFNTTGPVVPLDRGDGKTWSEKIFRREERQDGRAVTVWGM